MVRFFPVIHAILGNNMYTGYRATMRPVTAGHMLRVEGVGAKKLEMYGEAFMDLIRDFCQRMCRVLIRLVLAAGSGVGSEIKSVTVNTS